VLLLPEFAFELNGCPDCFVEPFLTNTLLNTSSGSIADGQM
jgi:hypothetical protein